MTTATKPLTEMEDFELWNEIKSIEIKLEHLSWSKLLAARSEEKNLVAKRQLIKHELHSRHTETD